MTSEYRQSERGPSGDVALRSAKTEGASSWWTRWKRLAHRAAEIQAYVLLTVLYALVVIPIGLLRRALVKSTFAGGAQPGAWQKRAFDENADRLQEARQQF